MKNLLNIDDKVKINMPGIIADGVTVEINSMQKQSDGIIHYIGIYHADCPDGGEGWEDSIQFTEDQYTALVKENSLLATISIVNSDKLVNLIKDITFKLNELKTFQLETKIEK